MAIKSKKVKLSPRHRRKVRIRKVISGSAERPRLCVFRSLKHTYAQLIDDNTGKVISAASTKDKDLDMGSVKKEDLHSETSSKKGVVAAKAVGTLLAKRAQEQKIETVVFDRNGMIYHGRIKALADGAREGGMKF